KDRELKIFSRRLSEVTESLPEIVDLIKDFKAEEVILDGEVVAVRNGKPLPFQELMKRFKRVHDIQTLRGEIPLKLYLFDILYLNRTSLLDEAYKKRRRILEKICGDFLAEQIITESEEKASEFLKRSLSLGHEGLIAKSLNSKYTPCARGKRWFKLKPTETLDCVIVAADWGYGRRTSWLSNYHLAVRSGDEYEMIGKTFKGLTDEEFKEMTKRLLSIKIKESRSTVYVKPEVVVEVAYSEIQKSPNYKSGYALRFARIKSIRYDKSPKETDTYERLRELYERQFEVKGRI
ncbi:MAG: ATP-dependent DNA ligase, partial [Candidatus Methanofastidiosia archaeon]